MPINTTIFHRTKSHSFVQHIFFHKKKLIPIMEVSMEVEVASSLSSEKLFKLYNNYHTIAPKVDPQSFKSITVIQGDGGVGSIISTVYGDGSTSKHTVDAIDTSNHLISYTYFEADVFKGIIEKTTHHIKFSPSPNGGAIYKRTIIFKCIGDAKLSDEAMNISKETIKSIFKRMESYAIAHPEDF
ncbi:putative Bet v I/Major latex protein [Helianthus annuus]|uniref:Bet v I/Major latex protein n=2 Tax=Helianthus annuus TaxID=4232 RepID=A0A9K3N016_HELAN|nr:putative Bet v I/Major latex protein [Helianthus annuus]KAJ0501513.1 putative Bet v I/Major latex protein [Helianthus annuus]KAJ0517420.1 putative Bet v I/Major latex protein [Helianthus annuus]KAJ0685431.1 putative Bet v I/Major latex protein [Helianthus annuus]KAJ0689325.1 putative Bet v I/Major latex protein [Helianthus annuus]